MGFLNTSSLQSFALPRNSNPNAQLPISRIIGQVLLDRNPLYRLRRLSGRSVVRGRQRLLVNRFVLIFAVSPKLDVDTVFALARID